MTLPSPLDDLRDAQRLRAWVRPTPCYGLVLVALAVSTTLFGLACTSAGHRPDRDPAFAPVTAHLPADTSWALVTGSLELSEQQLAAELDTLARQPGLAHLFRDRFDALLGVDIFDARDLARTGLDLRGDFALFGIELQPAFLVRIRDPQAFNRFIEDVRTRNEALVFSSQVVEGRTIHSVELGSILVSYTVLEESSYLLGVYHDHRLPVTELLGPVLRTSHGDAPALGWDPLFETSLAQLGHASHSDPTDTWHTVLFANSEAIDRGLLRRADPLRDPTIDLLDGQRRERFLANRRAWLARCQEASTRFTTQLPWLAAGLRFGDDGTFSQRLVAPVAAPVLDDLRAVLRPLAGPYARLAEDAIIAFAIDIDFDALSEVTTDRIELARCPNLAALEGIGAVLGTGLGRTDAAEVFAGPIYGALYAFDFNLSWFSDRSGTLVIATHDVEKMLDGFELYFNGIGAFDSGRDLDGTHYYGVFNGLLSVAVMPLEDHVALVLGAIDRDRLEDALATTTPNPSDTRHASTLLPPPAYALAPRIPSAGELGRLELDGARLRESLQAIVTQLEPTGLDTTLASAALEALGRLESATWRLRTEGDLLIIEGEWRTSPH